MFDPLRFYFSTSKKHGFSLERLCYNKDRLTNMKSSRKHGDNYFNKLRVIQDETNHIFLVPITYLINAKCM